MKTFKAFILALTCLVGSVSAQAQVINGLLMGSIDRVTQHCLENADKKKALNIFISQSSANGEIGVGEYLQVVKFSSKNEFDAFFHDRLVETCQGAITNNFGQDKTLSFHIYAEYVRYEMDFNNFVSYFIVQADFNLVKSVDGHYSLPDLSKVILGFPPQIVYLIKDLRWARVEVSNGDGLLRVSDSAAGIEPYPLVYVPGKALILPTDMALSGDTGPTRLRVSLMTGKNLRFQVFNCLGQETPESLPSFQILQLAAAKGQARTIPPQSINFEAMGGETGRTYWVQSSTNLTGSWTNSTSFTKTPFSDPFVLSDDITTGNGFYKLVPREGVLPIYNK